MEFSHRQSRSLFTMINLRWGIWLATFSVVSPQIQIACNRQSLHSRIQHITGRCIEIG